MSTNSNLGLSGNVAGQYTHVGFPLGYPTVYVNENGVQGL